MIFPLRRRAQAGGVGRRLYESAVRQARTPALYAVMGAPDTVEGRFELLSLHVILLIEALNGEGAAACRQALFDAFVGDLDGAMREMGVGDLAIGKRMRALGGAFYGRAANYRKAFETLPERASLESLISRTILAGAPDASPSAVASYAIDCREALVSQNLLENEPAWPTA
ncbi:MAG: ubiquinol-cytochrome C chaperone family protein [Caulobacteraceae bacterium]